MFTIFACASLFGEKINFELQFPGAPTLDELEHRITHVFKVEHDDRIPRGHPQFDFVVARLQIYDDSMLRWVDLVTPRQLHHLDQVYAFQPQSQWHIDVQKDLPAPRTPGGKHSQGVPSPRQYHSPAGAPRHSDPNSTPVRNTFSVVHNTPVSPPTSANSGSLQQQLEHAKQKEADLRRELAAATQNTQRLEKLVAQEKARLEKEKAQSQQQQSLTPQEEEIRRLREQLAKAEAQLKSQNAQPPAPTTAAKPSASTNATASSMNAKPAATNGMNSAKPAAGATSMNTNKPSSTMNTKPASTAASMNSKPTTTAAMNNAKPVPTTTTVGKTMSTTTTTTTTDKKDEQRAPMKKPETAKTAERSSFFDDFLDFVQDALPQDAAEDDTVGEDQYEHYQQPNYQQHYQEQNQKAYDDEIHEQQWQKANPTSSRPPPKRPQQQQAQNGQGLYRPGQQLTDLNHQPSMGCPAPPPRRWKGPGPTVNGNLKPLFEDGLLYRIVDGDTWYFYNDTQKYEMIITYTFGPDSEFEPLDTTRTNRNYDGWIVTELRVFPGETRGFINGTYNGYKSSLKADPVGREYRETQRQLADQVIQDEMTRVQDVSGYRGNEEQQLSACLQNGVKFVDTSFTPTAESLSRPGVDRRAIDPTAWKRPTQFLPKDIQSYVTVHRRIEPNDIDQGMLGDCWFLCSVASLAEFPSKVRDIFEHPANHELQKAEQAAGAYRVTLNKHGWWYIVVVDDYLPVIGNKPCFAKNVEDQTELWVSLLEKAYAKIHGSYAAIAGGDALHALQDLSGYPVSRVDDDEWKEARADRYKGIELFQMLLRYDESNYLINLNTPGQDDSAYMGAGGAGNSEDFAARYKRAGLGMGHAYSVLQVKEFPQYDLRLLQIRNPWGNGTEWTGAWGDDDSRWYEYPDVAEECNFEPGADGTFWMAWEDAQEYFDGGGACLTKFNWFDYRVRGSFCNGVPGMCFEVTVDVPTTCFLIFSQKDKRACTNYEYQALLLSVCKSSQGGRRMEVDLSSTSDADRPSENATFCYARDRAMKYTFLPEHSPYLVVPRLYDAADMDYVLGIISENRAGQGIDVTFKSMSPSCPVLENYLGFRYDGAVSDVSAEYQFNPEVGCPLDCRGNALSNV